VQVGFAERSLTHGGKSVARAVFCVYANRAILPPAQMSDPKRRCGIGKWSILWSCAEGLRAKMNEAESLIKKLFQSEPSDSRLN
jgi:hypothetical protein